MTTKDLAILDDLYTRTNNLPDILHLRAADYDYTLTDDDKNLLSDTYQKLDDILKEVAAFINIKFPGRQSHIHGWNKIDFDTKIGNIKIITNDREHIKRDWNNGMRDLIGLIKSLRNETVLLIDKESQPNKFSNGVRTNNFSGNIIYNEGKVTGKQVQSASYFSRIKNEIKKQKQDNAKVAKIIEWVLLLIGGAAAVATIYQVYKQFYP